MPRRKQWILFLFECAGSLISSYSSFYKVLSNTKPWNYISLEKNNKAAKIEMLEKGDWKFVQCTSRPFAGASYNKLRPLLQKLDLALSVG